MFHRPKLIQCRIDIVEPTGADREVHPGESAPYRRFQ